MLARLDAFPDAPGQMQEIWGHYNRISRRREISRLLDLEKRAKTGKDPAAQQEFAKAIAALAEQNGTTDLEELEKLKAHGANL